MPVHSSPPAGSFGHNDNFPVLGASPQPELLQGFEAIGVTPGSDQPQGLGSFTDPPTTLFFGDIPVHSKGDSSKKSLSRAALHQLIGQGQESRELPLHHTIQAQVHQPKTELNNQGRVDSCPPFPMGTRGVLEVQLKGVHYGRF